MNDAVANIGPCPPCTSPSSERMRRHRERQRKGIQVVPVEVDQEAVDNLVAVGLLNPKDVGDAQAASVAIMKAAKKIRYA